MIARILVQLWLRSQIHIFCQALTKPDVRLALSGILRVNEALFEEFVLRIAPLFPLGNSVKLLVVWNRYELTYEHAAFCSLILVWQHTKFQSRRFSRHLWSWFYSLVLFLCMSCSFEMHNIDKRKWDVRYLKINGAHLGDTAGMREQSVAIMNYAHWSRTDFF